jgi:acetylornithine deacetylase
VSDPVRILSELVAIDSVSARSNAEIADHLKAAVSRLGFDVTEDAYDDERGTRKFNLVAAAGPRSTPPGKAGLALVGHTDTVPYDPMWKEALQLNEREGKLFGRGAADTKAFIAGSLAAVEQVDRASLKKPLCLVFTADEELGCVGARHLLSVKALAPAFAVVGEPTQLRPVRAHKGYCLAEIEIEGREAHSAYPHLGQSAIFRAGRVLAAIEKLAEEIRSDWDPDFDPPYTTVNAGVIQGGKAKNIVAGSCRITFEWRPIPTQPSTHVQQLLERTLDAVRTETGGLPIRVITSRTDAGVSTPADAEIVRFFEKESGHEAVTIPFGTELPQMTALGAQGVVFGPGDIREAHKTGEFVPKAELLRATEILRRAIEKFCF